MTNELKNMIADQLAVLGIDVEKDADLARGYFLLSLANAHFGMKKPVRIDLSNNEFESNLKRFHVPFFSKGDSFSEEQRDAAESLIVLFQEKKLFENHRLFFDSFSPFLVDWERFSEKFSKDQGKSRMLAVLSIMLEQDDSLRKPHDVYIQFDPVDEILREQFDFTEQWLTDFELTQEDFIDCFDAIFSRPTRKISVKANGNIKQAISKYRAYFVPLNRLLIDYYLIKINQKSLDEAVNPWAYTHKGIGGIDVKTGVSVPETLFDLYVYPLREERPTDIIRNLFFSQSVSDSDFECSFLLSEFCRKVRRDSRVLVVHPSPDMILKWNEYTDSADIKTVYAVPNELFSELYQLEFPDKTFITFDQIQDQNPMDYVLITPRNLPEESMEKTLDCLDICSKKSEILGLFPNNLFDQNGCDVRGKLLKNGICLEQMMLVSSKVVASSPRKKVLMSLRKGAGIDEDSLVPTWYLSNWANGTYYISKEHFSVPTAEFLEGGLSLKTLFSRAILRKKRGEDLENTATRDSAEVYSFSSEIAVYYTMIAQRKNRFAGKAYYCSCMIPENSNRRRGKRLTEIIEAGLRAKTEAEVIQNLEWIPFNDRVYPFIVADLMEHDLGNVQSWCLKTIWFCLLSQLQKNKKYDEKLCLSMFCGEKQELSVLVPEQAKEEDYTEALACLLAPESKTTQLQYWVQLDLIFQCAMTAGLVRFNPITQQISEISAQATEEQREVRNALTKKTFSSAEEERMLSYLVAETSTMHKGRPLRRYEKESIWLAGAIKMFAGLSTREVCALQWRDLVKVSGTDVYQFVITKYVDDKGTLLPYDAKDGAKKIRKIPVMPMLYMLLQHRYQYLTETLGTENLREEPIVLRSENRKGNLFARPRYVTEKCHVLLDQAEIPVQMLTLPDEHGGKETDMNHYFGDIFLSNFRYRANHTCALTRGELNYMLGLELPDTFAKHYCDYSSDLMQYAMANKLQRWSTETPILAQMWYRNGRSIGEDMIVVNPHSDENAAIDLIIEALSDQPTDVEIEMDCELGFSCHMIRLEKGDRR